MLSPEMPFKLPFDGFGVLDAELDPLLLLLLLLLLSLFFPAKIPTGIATASMTTTAAIAIKMP